MRLTSGSEIVVNAQRRCAEMRRLRLVLRREQALDDEVVVLARQELGDPARGAGDDVHTRHAAERRHEVEVRQRRRQRAQRLRRVARRGRETAREQLEATGDAVARPARLGQRDRRVPSGSRSISVTRISAPDSPSSAAWWTLRQQPDLGPVLDPVDEVHLPQRPAAVEPALEDPRPLLGELAQVAGRGQRDLADVVVEVDVRLLDPERVVEAERDLDEAPAERREQVQALAQHRAQAADGDDAAGRGRGVVHGQAADVAVGPVVLERQELGVEARELSHGVSLAAPRPGASLSCGKGYPSGADAAIVISRTEAGAAREHRSFSAAAPFRGCNDRSLPCRTAGIAVSFANPRCRNPYMARARRQD